MEIVRDKMYINRTKHYLLPVLLKYGNNFTEQFKQVFKLGYGINDEILPDNLKFDNHIFILFNAYKNSNNGSETSTFINFLNWIRKQSYFEFDYPFDDIKEGEQHMIVLKIPDTLSDVHSAFLNSRYSKMYSSNDLQLLFGKDDPRFNIFTKHPTARKLFIDKINKDYSISFTEQDFDSELLEVDEPIVLKNEIFNYE
jgi:hypothetical protein